MSVERKLKASFNFKTLFFFLFFSITFCRKKTQKTIEAKHYGGESLWHCRLKIQEAAIISVDISVQKEGIVPKTTCIA